MKFIISVSVLFLSFNVQAQNSKKSTESLSSLMGALSHVIIEKTKIPGKTESIAKITPPAETTYKTLESELDDCQTSKTHEPEIVTIEKSGVHVEFKKFDLRIYGERCPLELNASLISTEQTQVSLTADFTVKIAFKKQSFIDKYKMKFIEITGLLKAKAEQQDSIVKIPVTVDLKGQGDSIEFGAFSQDMGLKVLVDVNLAQFNFNMLTEQTAFLQYQDVVKKGYSKITMAGFNQPEAIYTINDQKVSQSEFQLFLESFTLPGMISNDEPNQPDQKTPTQCSFAVYEKNHITGDALKTQLQSLKLQNEGLLAQGQSCLKDVSIPFKNDINTYTGDLKFGTEWVSFLSQSAVSEKFNGGVYVLYGDQAVQTNESEELIMGLKCQPTPSCH